MKPSLLIIPFLLIANILIASNYEFYSDETNPNGISTLEEVVSQPVILKEEAQIVTVVFSGEENNYTFNVGIISPDKGCNQYANWWEIVSKNETLIKRRILGHSHINEQPFVRALRGIKIKKSEIVIIRAHMNTSGYGTIAFKGSVETGFFRVILEENFASGLDQIAPLPASCAF